MKRILIMLFCMTALAAKAQPDDKVIYYEDSKVKKSRISLALNLDPNWTDRRLINNEVPTDGDYRLYDENAKGSLQFNYGLDVFVRLGSALRIGVGVGRASAGFSVEDASYYNGLDTILADVNTEVSMYTLPIKLNFSTALNDAFDLEVIPQVQLNFVDKYQNNYDPLNGASGFTTDLSDSTQSLIYSVGIALGGTFKFADNWGLFVRGDIKYMISPLIEQPEYPRETVYNVGLNVGLKYSF